MEWVPLNGWVLSFLMTKRVQILAGLNIGAIVILGIAMTDIVAKWEVPLLIVYAVLHAIVLLRKEVAGEAGAGRVFVCGC